MHEYIVIVQVRHSVTLDDVTGATRREHAVYDVIERCEDGAVAYLSIVFLLTKFKRNRYSIKEHDMKNCSLFKKYNNFLDNDARFQCHCLYGEYSALLKGPVAMHMHLSLRPFQ